MYAAVDEAVNQGSDSLSV